ncbi:MAG: hypothetical protein KC417_13090, partial [Myxococcales bacterium]|nr:hypothetical protein [Myxococcales bacterium]
MADSGQKLTPQGALRQLVILALLVGGAAFFHGAAPVVETSRASLMLVFGFIVLAGHSIGQLVGFL